MSTAESTKTYKKPAPRSWDQSKLRVFVVAEHEALIKTMAKGLEREEILLYMGLEISDLPEYDAWFFEVNFNRGRIDQKHSAVLKLVGSMTGGSALASSLAYLSRFGNEKWQDPKGTGSKVPKGLKIIVEDGAGNEI